jgi:hypothetical protein
MEEGMMSREEREGGEGWRSSLFMNTYILRSLRGLRAKSVFVFTGMRLFWL